MTQEHLNRIPLETIAVNVSECRQCAGILEPRPVIRVSQSAKLLIIGQAPGRKVHETGIPWNDPSGDRLREWLGLDRERFYDSRQVAIVPMGFCYPGKGRSGDLPPRPECQALWHVPLFEAMPHIEMTLLVGQYAQKAYLPHFRRSLTENVRHWRDCFPKWVPLVHPSPRNRLWLRRNPWFEETVVPALREEVHQMLGIGGHEAATIKAD